MSIKKKFATAVATASLLAGLFGSAFVPSAMGVVILPSDAVVAKYTTLNEESGVHQAGTAKSFGFQTNDAANNDGTTSVAIGINLFINGGGGLGGDQYDLTDPLNDEVILKAVSSNSNVELGWAYEASGAEEDCGDTDVDDNFAASSSVVDVAAADGAGAYGDDMYYLCFAAKSVATAATSTITVTVDGVVATTFSVTAVGPIASLTASITDGFKYVAEDNTDVDDWFTIIAKDAAGVVINGLSTSVSNENLTIYDWEDNPENVQESVVEPLNGSNTGEDSTASGATTQYSVYDLDSDTCVSESGAGEEDGDAGASFSVKFADAATDADVVSNALTITCTGGVDGARVTKVTAEATTGDMDFEAQTALDDDFIDIVATLVDVDGAPLGDGTDTYINGDGPGSEDMVISFDGNGDLNWNDSSDVVIGGEVLLGDISPDIAPGKHTYTITFEDSDLSKDDGAEVEKVFTLSYTAAFVGYDGDITKSRNAAKTTATVVADFGDDGQYGKIQFLIQNANGATRVVTLNAGSDGAATLVFSRRNQRVTVTAYLQPYGAGGYTGETETVRIRFR
jgi:hypothetical protein